MVAAAEIERECFSTPWSQNALTAELTNPGAAFFTAHVGEEPAGYAGMHYVLDEGYIANIAVAKRFRGQGIAKALLRRLITFGTKNGLRTITLEVRSSNEAALGLYRGFGFAQVGQRRGFYTNPTEDALLLTLEL